MSDFLRTFVAIELSEEMQEVINSAQRHFKKLDCDVKWVKPENAHITLKFLGDTAQDKLGEIKNVLQNTSRIIKSFAFSLTELGVFPSFSRPNIVWIGAGSDNDKMRDIAARLEEGLEKLGFPKETRAFKSHITIGRVKSSRNIHLLKKEFEDFTLVDKPAATCAYLTLFKSTLTPSGPVYEALEKFKFI